MTPRTPVTLAADPLPLLASRRCGADPSRDLAWRLFPDPELPRAGSRRDSCELPEEVAREVAADALPPQAVVFALGLSGLLWLLAGALFVVMGQLGS